MTATLLVAHLSDLHLGAHDPFAVASIADEVAAFRPDLTVVTGDHTMRARSGQFQRAAELIEKLPPPRLVVPGNHDTPLVSPLRAVAPWSRYRRWIGPLEPVVRLPGLTALGLNSMPRWRWKSGRISAAQSAAVRTVLGPAEGIRLVALHHPPLAGGLARIAGRSRFLQALSAAAVDVVLFGHTHVPSAVRHDGLLMVNAGTTTSHRVRDVPRSWTLLRLRPHATEVHERFEVAPGVWETGRVLHFG
ncbi:metallophosphoesterase family protein [Actinoplanes sp. CA-030573]|uniref:metallophosphoesterase family protein n=1 Tax=Actinoplanes sp. CA-030573 TaxID=3239898 RepID=UPI003D903618